MPERLAALPPALFSALAGVDLVLHAGDVGELWVLDALSGIAPVVAVHGNDDSADAKRDLPYQQFVIVAGRRILLTHGHLQDPVLEQETRRGEWEHLLARNAERARRAGASIVVSGHTHIPLATEYDGVQLINPGAIAPPNERHRQVLRSVAVLDVLETGATHLTHIDLASGQAFQPDVDLAAPFATAHDRVCRSILAPALEQVLVDLRPLRALAPAAFRAASLRAAHRCWSGALEVVGPQELLDELRQEPEIPDEVRVQLVALLGRAKPHLT